MHEITRKDLARWRKLKIGAASAPVLFSLVPVTVTFLLLLFAASGPPAAAVILFFGIVATIIGFVIGLGVSGFLIHKHSKWSREIRERIAADGIRAEEINWFRNEL